MYYVSGLDVDSRGYLPNVRPTGMLTHRSCQFFTSFVGNIAGWHLCDTLLISARFVGPHAVYNGRNIWKDTARTQENHEFNSSHPRFCEKNMSAVPLFLSSCFWLSAGVGRTGCFIVIDAMAERIKHEKTIDIYGHVTLMRSQRNYMVQTEDQYIFIHDALLEAVTCGNTEVPARNLYSYIQRLTQIEPGENVTGMELEFKVRANQHVLGWCKMKPY